MKKKEREHLSSLLIINESVTNALISIERAERAIGNLCIEDFEVTDMLLKAAQRNLDAIKDNGEVQAEMWDMVTV